MLLPMPSYARTDPEGALVRGITDPEASQGEELVAPESIPGEVQLNFLFFAQNFTTRPMFFVFFLIRGVTKTSKH